jgi:hypothetical protein
VPEAKTSVSSSAQCGSLANWAILKRGAGQHIEGHSLQQAEIFGGTSKSSYPQGISHQGLCRRRLWINENAVVRTSCHCSTGGEMPYRIQHNAGPSYTVDQYAALSTSAKFAVSIAHDLIWQFVTQTNPPFYLTGYSVGDGFIFDDPMPRLEYVGSLAGSWIWSSQIAYFRFRIIETKSKLDTWEYGPGPRPTGLVLVPMEPVGTLSVRGGKDGKAS